MRVHRKQSAERESRPRELWHVVKPAAEREHEQVAELVEQIERWAALQAGTRPVIVEQRRRYERREPPEHPRAFEPGEQRDKRRLHERDLPREPRELRRRAARTEKKGILARIEPVGVRVDEVV